MSDDIKQMSAEEIREQVIRLGFDGNAKLFDAFCKTLRDGLPKGTGVALRGSVVTNERWEDGAPFDAEGRRTSDLDVTLIGQDVMVMWNEDAFYIPLLHTKPLGDENPEIAVGLDPVRREVQRLVKRPVHFQATSNMILFARDVLFGQPYFMIIEAQEDS